MEIIENKLGECMLLMEIILTSHFEKNSPEKEESGKILGRDLWVRAH